MAIDKSRRVGRARLMLVALLSLVSGAAWSALEITICGGSNYTCTGNNMQDVYTWTPGSSGDGTIDALQVGDEINAVVAKEPGEAGSGVRVPLSPAAEKVPPGWQDAQTPPAETTKVEQYNYEGLIGNSVSAVASQWVARAYANATAPYHIYAVGDVNSTSFQACGWASMAPFSEHSDYPPGFPRSMDCVWRTPTKSMVCPTGYVADGAVCDLVSPAAVMKPADDECGLAKVEGVITMDPQDPDCSGSGGAGDPLGIDCSGGKCTVTDGETKVEWGPAAGGGERIDITHTPPGGSSSGYGFTVNPGAGGGGGGVIIGKDTIGDPGGGDPGGGDPGGGDPGGEPGEFCPHCATEATLRQVRDRLQEGIGIDEKGSEWAQVRGDAETAGQGAIDALDAHTAGFNQAAGSGDVGDTGVPGLAQFEVPTEADDWGLQNILPSGTGVCTPLEVTWSGSVIVFDYCPIVSAFGWLLNWGFAALTLIYVYSRIYRKEGAA